MITGRGYLIIEEVKGYCYNYIENKATVEVLDSCEINCSGSGGSP